MQDSTPRKPDGPAPDADATSRETLKDLQDEQKDSGSGSNDSDDESELPSPDGAEDERDEMKDAGPM
jgi:hypothetical protein